jgi:hypothetical protein
LRDTLAPSAQTLGNALLTDAVAARNDYISVVLDRARDEDASGESTDQFLARHATIPLSPALRQQALELMELERHAQLMYTSCGWFFDEISGIETLQIIAYACRVIELATKLFGKDVGGALPHEGLEDSFIGRLSQAKSNVPDLVDGGVIYSRLIEPMRVGLEQVAAHYAISSVFSGSKLHDAGTPHHELYCYSIENLERRTQHYGAGQVTLGRAGISAKLTGESGAFAYAVLHFGDQNLTAAVKRFSEDDSAAITWLNTAVDRAVSAADLPEVVRLVDGYFGESAYSLTSLFSDEQRRILNRILQPTLDEVEFSMTTIHREHASLLHFLSRAGLPKPGPLTIAAQIAVNSGLRRALEQEPVDSDRILDLIETARADMVVLETAKLGFLADQRMKSAMVRLQQEPADHGALTYALSLARTLRALPFTLNLWQAQNLWYELHLQGEDLLLSHEGHQARGGMRNGSHASLEHWRKLFPELGRQLFINRRPRETGPATPPAQKPPRG